MERTDSVADRIATVLTCLATDPQLGGVLFIELQPAMLMQCARWLRAAISVGGARAPEIEPLGSHDSDENLWWRLAMPTADGMFGLAHRHGPIVDPRSSGGRIVAIPDLATASLAVKRAAVTLIGADEASAERHGRQYLWRPRSLWLAACREEDLLRLSGHLLDRFAVRVLAAGLAPRRPQAERLRAALDSTRAEAELYLPLPPPPVVPALDRPMPRLTQEARALVVTTLGVKSPGIRRELALARVARALAMIEGAGEVTQTHVLAAAATIGVSAPEPETPAQASGSDGGADAVNEQAGSSSTSDMIEIGPPSETGMEEAKRIDQVASVLEAVEVSPHTDGQASLFLEDSAGALPDHASLRMPWQRRASIRRGRGVIIGTEATTAVEDLAIVATLMEAAKFQPIRRLAHQGGPNLLIGRTDLRRFRRQGHPDTALVFVLDHTCRGSWKWDRALVPYLRWAHVQRASISVIEFGHATNPHPLRAERYRAIGAGDVRLADSIDPSGGLHQAAGYASPLAHALELAAQELRRQTRRGQVRAGRCWLVVASDGRGNVPLEASLRQTVIQQTSREGINDALEMATKISSMAGVHTVVLAPPDIAYYAQLPFVLAHAMGGIVADPEVGQ